MMTQPPIRGPISAKTTGQQSSMFTLSRDVAAGEIASKSWTLLENEHALITCASDLRGDIGP